MEKISTKKLPPIFKMSVLWNILPYYGHLHRWRRLLEKINTKTKDIWDNNREQLMYIGRDFKRDIELEKLKENARHLRPNRSWIDLFTLSLSTNFNNYYFDLTTLIDNLSEDEVIIIDFHDDIFKRYQIQYWSKDSISDILPAIKCPSFKPETKIFKTSETHEMRWFIDDKDDIKSIVIENTDKKLYLNLVYGDTIKITLRRLNMTKIHAKFFNWTFLYNRFFNKLKERYSLWGIDDCACKPKKIRVLTHHLEDLKYAIGELESISHTNDFKLGIHIYSEYYGRYFSNYDIIVFNHSVRRISDKNTNLIFTGDTLAAVYHGNYYNFRLDQRTKESECSSIKGKI